MRAVFVHKNAPVLLGAFRLSELIEERLRVVQVIHVVGNLVFDLIDVLLVFLGELDKVLEAQHWNRGVG